MNFRVIRVIINNSPVTPPMTLFNHDDVTDFAEYLGLIGLDADLFYESYYNLDNRELEKELDYEENYPA